MPEIDMKLAIALAAFLGTLALRLLSVSPPEVIRTLTVQSIQHYSAVLGVHIDATPEQVRAAYLSLVKLWHPDRFTHSPQQQQAEAEIKKINQAYEALQSQRYQSRVAYTTDSTQCCRQSNRDRRWNTVLKTYSKPQVHFRLNPDLDRKFGR